MNRVAPLLAMTLLLSCTEPKPEPSPEAALPYSFPGELVACNPDSEFNGLTPILSGGKVNPTGRGEHAAAYDPCQDRIILFGGNDFQPEQCATYGPKRFKEDTWVYSPAHQNYVRLLTEHSPHPRGRAHMTTDLSRKKLYLYGGRYRQEGTTGTYTVFDDLWEFDLNTESWRERFTTGDLPGPRTNSGLVYDPRGDRLVLFGGNSTGNAMNFLSNDHTFVLDLKTMTWSRLNPPAPGERLFHAMVYSDTANAVFVYGGASDTDAWQGPFYADLWRLDLSTLTWSEVEPESSSRPDARISARLVADDARDRLVLIGGHDDTIVGNRNDVWAFNLSSSTWTLLHPGDSGAGERCNAFCDCPPDFVETNPNVPERRHYHSAQHLPGPDWIAMFGGKSDCGYLDDTWYWDLSADVWLEINPASQGEACMRSGRDNCTDLCY